SGSDLCRARPSRSRATALASGVMSKATACFSARRPAASAAIEDVVAEVLHFEDRDIRAALDRVRHMRFGHLADDDVVVALLDDAGDLAFDGGQGGIEDRRAVGALVDRLAGQLAALE